MGSHSNVFMGSNCDVFKSIIPNIDSENKFKPYLDLWTGMMKNAGLSLKSQSSLVHGLVLNVARTLVLKPVLCAWPELTAAHPIEACTQWSVFSCISN